MSGRFSQSLNSTPFPLLVGSGTAPAEQKAMVETTIRKVAQDDPAALGPGAPASHESWGAPERHWRKREVNVSAR